MPAPQTFSSVADWVAAEYSAAEAKPPKASAASLSRTGMQVVDVHPHSPAGMLGVRGEDILYYINGRAFDDEALGAALRPRRFGRAHRFDLLRPGSGTRIRITGPALPFGLQLAESVQGFAMQLRSGDPDVSEVAGFWARGDAAGLAVIWAGLEVLMIRVRDMGGQPLSGPLPQSIPDDSPLPDDEAYPVQFGAWLALAAAHAGQWGRARWVLDRVERWFEDTNENAMMSLFAAMAYTRALLAEHESDRDAAIAHLHHAADLSPETPVIYRKLSELVGAKVDAPASPFIGTRPALELPRRDPKGAFAQPPGEVSLRERAAALRPRQLLLLILLAGYRSNGPHVEGLRRALLPLSRLAPRITEAITVTSWDHPASRPVPYPLMEDELRGAGVQTSLLFDAGGRAQTALSLISAPTNLFIDHRGVVVAEGWLGDDRALWDALAAVS